MILVGQTNVVIDSCDCKSGDHRGHVRYLDFETRRNPRKYIRRGGPKTIQQVCHVFSLNGHPIPGWLGRWFCHRKVLGHNLVDYQREQIEHNVNRGEHAERG